MSGKEWFMFFLVAFLLFSYGFFVGKTVTYGVDTCVSIPNHSIIRSFCKSQGYEYGWLSSSSCGANEVMCYKSVGNLDQSDCLNVEVFR